MLVCLVEGKPENTEKNPRSKADNQTTSTHIAPGRNRTWVASCAIPVPLKVKLSCCSHGSTTILCYFSISRHSKAIMLDFTQIKRIIYLIIRAVKILVCYKMYFYFFYSVSMFHYTEVAPKLRIKNHLRIITMGSHEPPAGKHHHCGVAEYVMLMLSLRRCRLQRQFALIETALRSLLLR